MILLVIGFILSFFTGLTLTRLFISLAPKFGLMDIPNERSSHKVPVPRGGGFIIVLGFTIACMAAAGWSLSIGLESQLAWQIIFIAILAFIIALIGLFDDVKDLPVLIRFSCQLLIATTVVIVLGPWQTAELPEFFSFHLGIAGWILPIIWIVGLINAYNFMDGIDGLSTGQGVVASFGWVGLGIIIGIPFPVILPFICLCGLLLAFLHFNWSPARVFMGDVCSGFLGFVFAVIPLLFHQEMRINNPGQTAFYFMAALLLWPFLADSGYTFLRRAIKKENVFRAHRSHLYQRLTIYGYSHSKVSLFYILLGISGLGLTVLWVQPTVFSFWITVISCSGLFLALFTVVHLARKKISFANARPVSRDYDSDSSAPPDSLEFDTKPNQRIFLSPPHMEGDELEFIKKAFESNYIAPVGPQLNDFEIDFSFRCVQGKYCLAVNSGTSAIWLAYSLAGVKPGTTVVCSDFTFVASAGPALHLGAEVAFVDSDEASWNMDPAMLNRCLEDLKKRGKQVSAVMAVHAYGQSCDLDPIIEVCRKHEVTLLEDAAEALGASYKNRPLGINGFANCFSFNGNKIITTSAGGMLVVNDWEDLERAKFLATQAREKVPHYEHKEIGDNLRMSNVLAGLGISQLRQLENRVAKRREIFDFYKQALESVPGISFMPEPDWSKASRWLTSILIDPDQAGFDKESLRLFLAENHIECRPLWKPMHMQPVFKSSLYYGTGVGEKLFERGLSLPSGSNLQAEELEKIVGLIKKFSKEMRS